MSQGQPRDPSEADLLERAKQGDRTAFGGLVRLHQKRVYGCAMHMLANAAEADDALQETFVRAWKALPRFDGRAALSTWLFRICVNVCLNLRRRRGANAVVLLGDPRLPSRDPVDPGSDPGADAELRQLQARMLDALDGLTESLRTTVVVVLIQGLSHGEAAQLLGCSEGTVAWRIHEARRRLRDALLPFRLSSRAPGTAAGAAATSSAAVVAVPDAARRPR